MIKEELKQKAVHLPKLPGVYLMKDQEGQIIYVGKSKNLRSRVSSYFGPDKHHPSKVKRMVRHIKSFDYEVTDTELDALLLECRLIKKIKPIYNKLLKEDKKYCFLSINRTKPLPRFRVSYEKGEDAKYFGPYNMKSKLSIAAKAINTYYKFPTCTKPIKKEECLRYRRNLCLGGCEEKDQSTLYIKNIKEATNFLKGKNQKIIKDYEKNMKEAAEHFEFEKASLYRDELFALKMLHFRKEAIAFSQSMQQGVAFIKRPEKGLKCYGLIGTTIIFTQYVEENKLTNELMEKFKNKKVNNKACFEKEEIDEIYIMYSFLIHNQDCEYKKIKN